MQLPDQYGEREQRLHEGSSLPDQGREPAQLCVNTLRRTYEDQSQASTTLREAFDIIGYFSFLGKFKVH